MVFRNKKESIEDQLLSVSAPEDFPNHLRSLTTLDSTLRCPICKDFYQAPVIIHITNCCHTFCSACIRTSFNNNSDLRIRATGLGGVGSSQRCPICKVQAQEEKLKPVPTLEAAVKIWEGARSDILKLIEQVKLLKPTKDYEKDDNLGSTERDRNNGEGREEDSNISKNSSRLKRSESPSTNSREKSLSENSTTKDSRPTRRSSQRNNNIQKSSKIESDSEIEILDPKTLVNCPICDLKLPNSSMDFHVTKCLNGETQPSSSTRSGKLQFKSIYSSSNPNPNSKPVKTLRSNDVRNLKSSSNSQPKLKDNEKVPDSKITLPHFSSMKMKELKSELNKHNLSTEGSSTNALSRRLSRYITLHNANLDSNPIHRKSLKKLRQELDEWEKLQDLDNINSSNNAKRRRLMDGQSEFSIDRSNGNGNDDQKRKGSSIFGDDESDYVLKNKDQFKILTERARMSLKKINDRSEPHQNKTQSNDRDSSNSPGEIEDDDKNSDDDGSEKVKR